MDKEFILGEDETPEVKACLLHPDQNSKKTFTVKVEEGFAGVLYGLCGDCLLNLEDSTSEIETIIKTVIDQRLTRLKSRRH